ncbi:restriction endonuclease subunit S [Thalassolituus sp.]|jgi:type I restriction enzyme S subunit|uniref:restriction endonuclease subunit S n=1 Tax=Thalassolituus sp. TaxID=2030822 RepID=UPI0032D90E5A
MTNQVAEVSAKYLSEVEESAVPAGYKQTEVGVIPKHWNVIQLKELGLDISDGNYSSKYPRTDEFKSLGVPFIRANNIKGLTVVDHDMRYISYKKHSEITKGHLKEGDVLITNRGEIGNIAVVPLRHVGSNINAQIVRINTGKSALLGTYFAFYLQRTETNQRLLDMQTGSALKQLPVNRLLTLPIIIPSNEEQTTIANALSDVDALITELEKLITKKQAIKTATMQQLLTGRTRLPEFSIGDDGSPKGYKQSELGEIPEDWEVVQLSECAETITKGTTPMTIGKSFVGQGITFVKVESINESGQFDFSKFAHIDNETDRLLARSRIKENDLLISIAGALGRSIIVTSEILPANTNQALAIVRLSSRSLLVLGYLYHFTKTIMFHHCIAEIASQGAQPNLSLGDLGAFKITVPGAKEQTAIATILSDMDQEIQALVQRLNKTRQIKQGMMQELLTGKTRLIKPSKEVTHE